MAILEAVSDALMSLDYTAQDGATVALAAKLAQEIDASHDPKIIGELSSRLLTVLIQLGMTPASRTGVAKGGSERDATSGATNVLDELRSRRARSRGTANLDATS